MWGKTAVIMGASGAIGAACAKALCKNGYSLILCYNSSEKKALALQYEIALSGGTVKTQKCNVTSFSDCKEAINTALSSFGSLDLLVNAFGISQIKQINDITDIDFDSMMDVNIKGVFNATKAAIPQMIAQKSGKIVNISSIWGICGASCESHYSAAKAAVLGFTKACAKELGPSGITVNAIAPGVIKSPMNDVLGEATLDALKEETPLGRLGNVEDVASALLYLALSSGDFITGQVISPNGGIVI
jgi:3-oxoacyl-[acyl-carrier protein] reductase